MIIKIDSATFYEKQEYMFFLMSKISCTNGKNYIKKDIKWLIIIYLNKKIYI